MPRRMLKKTVQQGRSERRGEAYSVRYVEPLSEARTMLADFFSILLSDPLPGRPNRQIRIERQADFRRASPSKDTCANNSDLIQHH